MSGAGGRGGPRLAGGTRVLRPGECYRPPVPVAREVLAAQPADPAPGAHPVLLVPGLGHGAWVYAEHWLEHIAGRGIPAYAMSPRGHGASGHAPGEDLRAYAHDVVQVAAGLPRQAVLVGAGGGAVLVAMAMARYPARAGVLVAPVFPGPATALALSREQPAAVLPALFGRPVRPGPRQLFGADLPAERARGYAERLSGVPRRVAWRMARPWRPERPVGQPPVLVLGSPDDRMVSRTALDRVAGCYGGAPLLFPGMGHDLMLDERWQEPVDAICDWLAKLG